MKNAIAIAAVAGLAGVAAAQTYEISLVAPEVVNPGDTWTVEVWASWSGIDEGPAGAALAGFAVTALGSGGTSAANLVYNPSLTLGTAFDGFDGGDALGVVGGQLSNFFGLNPNVNTNNPIMLFSFEATADAGFFGDVTYSAAPGRPGVNPTLAVYPNSTGATSVNSDASGAELILGSATTTVIPAPAGLALLGLGGLAAARRRR